LNRKKTRKYGVGNPGYALMQGQKCVGVKPVNVIPTLIISLLDTQRQSRFATTQISERLPLTVSYVYIK